MILDLLGRAHFVYDLVVMVALRRTIIRCLVDWERLYSLA